MSKKKRHKFTGSGNGKYPQRPIVSTKDAEVQAAFYEATDEDAPLGDRHIAAGYVKHPTTGLYQVWVSTNGFDFMAWAAFDEEAKAGATVTLIEDEVKAGHFSDPEMVEGLLEVLREESDAEPLPLPDEMIRKLARDILHRVIELPEPEA